MKNQKEKKRKKWRETLAAGDEEGIYIEAAETVIGKTSKEEKLSYGLKQGVMRPHRSNRGR